MIVLHLDRQIENDIRLKLNGRNRKTAARLPCVANHLSLCNAVAVACHYVISNVVDYDYVPLTVLYERRFLLRSDLVAHDKRW